MEYLSLYFRLVANPNIRDSATRPVSARCATLGDMTHDPLCDWLQTQCTVETCDALRLGDPCEHQWCQCELIAKVRADQIERDATIVEDFGWSPETDDADIRQLVASLRGTE